MVEWYDPNEEGLCIWAAYQPVYADSFADSLVDISGNGNDAGIGVAPTWDEDNGWMFDGLTQYLTTTFIPQNDQSQSILVQFTGAAGISYIAGMSDGAVRNFGGNPALFGAGGIALYENGNVIPLVGQGYVNGNWAIAGNQGYRNGVAHGGAIGAWAGAATRAVYIGCANIGAPANYFPGNIQALAIYNCALTPGQVLAIATAMAVIEPEPEPTPVVEVDTCGTHRIWEPDAKQSEFNPTSCGPFAVWRN